MHPRRRIASRFWKVPHKTGTSGNVSLWKAGDKPGESSTFGASLIGILPVPFSKHPFAAALPSRLVGAGSPPPGGSWPARPVAGRQRSGFHERHAKRGPRFGYPPDQTVSKRQRQSRDRLTPAEGHLARGFQAGKGLGEQAETSCRGEVN